MYWFLYVVIEKNAIQWITENRDVVFLGLVTLCSQFLEKKIFGLLYLLSILQLIQLLHNFFKNCNISSWQH